MIDLRSILGVTEDPAARARRELDVIRAERDKRAATTLIAAPAPPPEPPPVPREDRVALAEYALAGADPDAVVGERCRRSLSKYVKEQWQRSPQVATKLEWGPHLDAICMHIQGQLEDAAARRENPLHLFRAQNLLINCPPRSLKTIILTFANAWAWIHWPWMQIMYLSATPQVVHDSARLFRDIVTGAWYQRLFVRGAWKIRDDQDALGSMGNTAGGARRSKGFGANILGLNSDWLCVDDAHSMDDSDDVIAGALANYDGNISSRMNDPRSGIRTAIMQRAARGDFSDHVLAHGWFHLRMPMEFERHPECRCPQCALCETGTPNAFGWVDWRKTEGEVIHARFTPEFLAERRRVLRPHGYAGQMQQRPAPKEGNQFKVAFWRYFAVEGDEAPSFGRPHGAWEGPAYILKRRPPEGGLPLSAGRLDVDWVCLSVDASGGSTDAKASALGLVSVAGKAERRFILMDRTPGPRSWLQTVSDIAKALVATSDFTGWHTKIRVLIEHKALGQGAMEQIQDAIAGGKIRDRWGRAVVAVVEGYEPTGKGNKEKRAEFMEPMAEGGLIYLHDGAEWLVKPHAPGAEVSYVDEFGAFPKGKDDRVDSTAQALDRYRKKVSDWARLFKGPR